MSADHDFNSRFAPFTIACSRIDMFLLLIPVSGCFFFFMILNLLSRHSSHSSDEADFNDPSLLENLQSNHVSNARAPCLPSAGLAGTNQRFLNLIL